jgi:ribose 5-phosphate isomerase A
MSQAKLNAAREAIKYLLANYQEPQVIGIGTGSTTNLFIQELAQHPQLVKTTVSSSIASTNLLKAYKLPVAEFNDVDELPVYIDGADSFNKFKQLIKGHGGALVREKVLAYQAQLFICLVDDSKKESILGTTFVPLEVLPMARSAVARQIVKLGGQPHYRESFVTDNGNIILDVHGWHITQPLAFEQQLNNIPGVIDSGLFALRPADVIIVGQQDNALVI